MNIKINNLIIKTIIGVYDWERKKKRKIFLNIDLEFDASKVIESDNLEDTIDYDGINRKIIDFAKDKKFLLIETLSAKIIDLILEDKKIKKARLELTKPKCIKHVDSVTIVSEKEN